MSEAHAIVCPCCHQPWSVDPAMAAVLLLDELLMAPQRRLIGQMMARRLGRFVRKPEMIAELYGTRPDGGPVSADKVLDVLIWHLRHEIAGTGLLVERRTDGAARLLWDEDSKLSPASTEPREASPGNPGEEHAPAIPAVNKGEG